MPFERLVVGEAGAAGARARLAASVDVELVHHPLHVRSGRLDADERRLCDLAVRAPGGDVRKDLDLPRGGRTLGEDSLRRTATEQGATKAASEVPAGSPAARLYTGIADAARREIAGEPQRDAEELSDWS